MKLRFNIHYNTEWGQAMHVLVNYKTSDGRLHEQDLMMQTEDGGLWWLDVVLMESRQRRIVQIEYVYQVEDASQRVLRREWNQVKRLYATDNTKTFCFTDLWRDVPLNYHLYTYIHRRYAKGVEAVALPLFRKTIVSLTTRRDS